MENFSWDNGGGSKTEVEISGINADIGLGAFTYGISGKSEWKLGGSNFYAGMYADYIQTENLVDENLLGEKLRLQSVGAAFTLGYSFNKNISTNVYIGGAANKFISDMDWEASPLYGLSVDYTYGYFTHGIMARYLDLSVGDIDLSNTALMYRIGLSF